MAAVQRRVSVTAERVDTEIGLWCLRCMRSSGIRVWILFAWGDRSHLQERLWCVDCESGSHVINDRT